jgi:hypothetical protein
MAPTFDASRQPAHSGTAVNPAKLQDEIHRLSQRLVRARESYNQDSLGRDPEVPLDEQLAVIESYQARLDIATEQLRQHDAGGLPLAEVPEQPSPPRAEPSFQPEPQPTQVFEPQAPPTRPFEPQAPQARPFEPQVPQARPFEPQVPQTPAPAPYRTGPALTGPGIANPDGTPLLGDGGTILRNEEVAVGEYVRHVADQRWLTTTGRAGGDELNGICEGILAALAHKHGVPLEDERQRLARQVDARYRRDYG